MFLHELAWGGVYFSPLLIYALISLVLTAITVALIHKAPLSRFITQEAWFEVTVFAVVLACVTGIAGTL